MKTNSHSAKFSKPYSIGTRRGLIEEHEDIMKMLGDCAGNDLRALTLKKMREKFFKDFGVEYVRRVK